MRKNSCLIVTNSDHKNLASMVSNLVSKMAEVALVTLCDGKQLKRFSLSKYSCLTSRVSGIQAARRCAWKQTKAKNAQQ